MLDQRVRVSSADVHGDEKRSWSPALQRSVLSVFNLQRTYVQIKKLQVPRRDKDTYLEIAGLFIVFAEFPGVYKDGRTMVPMEEEDVLPPSPLYFPP